MALPQTLINGNRYSFVNLQVNMAGVQVPTGVFKSINYEASQDPGIVQGNQVTPVGRTQGYATGTGSFEMLVSELDLFFLGITAGGVFPIMDVDFDIITTYSVNGIDTRSDILRGVRITKIGSSNQQGNDASTKSCDLSIMRIVLNGVSAFADPIL